MTKRASLNYQQEREFKCVCGKIFTITIPILLVSIKTAHAITTPLQTV